MNINTRYALLAILLSVLATGCGGDSQNGSDSISDVTVPTTTQSPVSRLLTPIEGSTPYNNPFNDSRVTEVSGIQRSSVLNGIYYVHNDSGDSATLYVTDAAAMVLGTIRLANVQANDWEAIAGARLNGEPHLVVGDIGDNDQLRNDLRLQIVEEPDFNTLSPGFDIELQSREVGVSYADGASYDAEALFIDGDNDSVVVLTKNGRNTSDQSIWKGSLLSGLNDSSLVLEFRGTVALNDRTRVNSITDIDIHPDGRQLALLTYGVTSSGVVHIWSPQASEGTTDALTRPADRTVNVPVTLTNFQAEGISYSADGRHLLVGAEGRASSVLTVVSAAE